MLVYQRGNMLILILMVIWIIHDESPIIHDESPINTLWLFNIAME